MTIALTRALVAAFWLATSVYALLCAIPFASQQFIKPELVPAIARFADWHHWIGFATLALAAAGLGPWLRRRHRGATAFIALWLAVVVVSFAAPGLRSLEPSATALAVCLASLIPPVWLSRLELGTSDGAPADAQTSVPAEFAACMIAAVVVMSTHSVLSIVAAPGEAAAPSPTAAGGSLLLHLTAFAAIFAVSSIIRGLGRFTLRPHGVEASLGRVALASAVAIFIYRTMLASLSFTGATAAAVAVALAAALAFVLSPRGTSAPPGLATAVAGLTPRWAARSAGRTAIWLIAAMAVIAGAERAVAHSDWNFAVGKLLALGSWLVALGATVRLTPSLSRGLRWNGSLATVATYTACVLLLGVQQIVAGPSTHGNGTAGTDASTRLLVDALMPPAVADDALYAHLQRNTNIAHSVRVDPVPVDLAPLTHATARRPHVFMFVVDSLRRDYLSPYNPRVTFTPAIQGFAGESTVFERAFTRYGATGLSVPSIWVGGFVLHKQYVTPFGPMNALAKLLAAQGYAEWLSVDNIVETIVPARPAREPLDGGVPVKDYRLCATLQEVRGRLDRLAPDGPPAFVYSLPQDLHVSAITREGSQPIDSLAYDVFNEAYASRVRRLDRCFGEFIGDLKRRGLYEHSVVILTSDHGDSLGEEGRMGHAYTIFPEIIQVPLLVHLPAELRAEFAADAGAAAFTSDLTPSLYALLGHTPARPASIFGQPLFRRRAEPPPRRAAAEVVASSYGSVYGALLNDARRLYIIDAVSLREHAYDLDGSGAGRRIEVRPADREAGQRAIRATVDEIAAFHKFQPQ